MPFHSPYVDPIGSIIGLRVLCLDGKLCYVPIEPELNYLINQQFGNSVSMHNQRIGNFSSISNERDHAGFMPSKTETQPTLPYKNKENYTYESPTVSPSPQRMISNPQHQNETDGPSWTVPHPQPQSGVRRSRLWFGESNQTSQSGSSFSNSADRPLVPFNGSVSMPNLQKKNFSPSEQHKMDLLKQIEENKRRRELEKEWERKEEEREIRRLERYNEKIRQEEEEEKRKLKERAQKLERQSQEIMESNRNKAVSHRFRSSPVPPEREQRHSSSNSNESRLEWWEKKPTWQEKVIDDHGSAVSPAIRSKSVSIKSNGTSSRRSANSYDPAVSVERHRLKDTKAHRSTQQSDRNHHNERNNHSQWSSASSERNMPSRSSGRISRQENQPSQRISRGEYTSATGNYSGDASKFVDMIPCSECDVQNNSKFVLEMCTEGLQAS